jgi:hypothetical protein
VREDERCASFVWSANQKSNADTNGGQDVDWREPQDDLMQLFSRQSAYDPKDDQHC